MPVRTIELREAGSLHGFIRRMVSPGDLGERIKPFVFLDFIHGTIPPGAGFGFHPHSGIATLTYQLDADVSYEDTTGQKGLVAATGLEWMRAGGGTWHQGFIHAQGQTVTGFQLWLALPPGVEDGPSEGIYVSPADVPQVGNVRVLLGEYGGAVNPIPAPAPVTYLDVVLDDGERWAYDPPATHEIAWVFVYRGRARVGGAPVSAELVVLDRTGTIEVVAEGPTRVLVGIGVPHDHPLVLGSHSVHTSPASLARGVARIRDIGVELKRDGRR
ncbi:MAG: pirin family protein [Pseudomonadota bacterium]|nr:pirin family protein [Pseudomonadota bacterium]